MKFKRIGALLLTLSIGGTLIGCGGSSNNSSDNAGTAQEAKNSGKVVVYTAGPDGLAQNIADAFKEETGIEMEIFQGTTGKILAKLEAEKSNPIADVVVLASWPAAVGMKNDGLTLAYEDAKNADKLYDGWVDADKHIFGYSGSAVGIVYNTNLVKNPGQDWNDYLSADYKDSLNLPDPSSSGSAMDLISGYMESFGEDGWKYFEGLKGNGAVVAGANKEALEPVITGAKKAVIGGVDYMAYSSKAKGEPIDIIYPKSGTVVNPRTVSILKDAPNMENAKKAVDFFLSDTAQKLVDEAYIIPGRSDIKSETRANLEDIKLLNYNLNTMGENEKDKISKFQQIFN